MKINLYDIYYYYLTCNNKIRKDHITDEFKKFKLVEVNPIMDIEKNKSGPSGFSRILDQACIDQDKNKPFQPFVILEDDVKKFEPKLALDGGNDGLDVIKKVIYKSKHILKTKGMLALEIGNEQFKKVSKILKENKFKTRFLIKDYRENIRCILSTLEN